jgi:hypothetical protein
VFACALLGCALDRSGLGDEPAALGDSASDTTVSADTAPPPDTTFDTAVAETAEPDTFAPDTSEPDTTVADADADAAVSCTDPGGVLWNGHCYFPLSAAAAFDAQRDRCIAAGAHLASITSAAENAIVDARGGGDRWIGLIKDTAAPSAKSSFRWITGESSQVYDNWSAGDPNGGHNCARMMAGGMWGDNSCTNAFPAVCERE